MTSKKSSIQNIESAGKSADPSLGKALLKILGAGIALTAILTAGGKKVGEAIQENKDEEE